jgi:hypothetical protein
VTITVAPRVSVGPAQRSGNHGDAVDATVCLPAGGDHRSVDHVVAKFLLQPAQVADIVVVHDRIELDLQGEHTLIVPLDDQIDLLPAFLRPEMIRVCLGGLRVNANGLRDE